VAIICGLNRLLNTSINNKQFFFSEVVTYKKGLPISSSFSLLIFY
jgi:hypothetical protein